MKKNKSLFFIVAILLAVTCLFISCSAEVSNAAGDKGLVYATFDNGSKTITPYVTISYDLIDLNQAYWVYTATKNDAGGKTGEGSFAVSKTLDTGLSGTIGPFSVGSWTFSVAGYKTKSQTDPGNVEKKLIVVDNETWYLYDKVFAGTNDSVSLTTGTESAPAPIDISVNLVTDGEGQLVLDKNFKFAWAGAGGATELQMNVYGAGTLVSPITLTKTEDYYTFGTEDLVYNVEAGDYTLNVEISYSHNDVKYVVATVSNLAVKVYSGQTTRIDAAILEGNFVYATINASLKSTATTTTVVDTAPTTFVTSYTPASVKSGSVSATEVTTVEFEAGAIAPTGGEEQITEYILTTNVSDLESAQNRGFNVTTGYSAAGSIDLSLKKVVGTLEPVDAEITGNVRIVTYIATNLSDVNVHYDGTGSAPTAVSYDPETGRLSFVTNHFSEYYVTTTSEAYNSNKVKAYDSLSDALTEIAKGDTIILLKDIENSPAIQLFKDIIFDGNGHYISFSGERGIRVSTGNVNVVVKNIELKGGNNFERALQVDNNMENVHFSIDNVTATATYYTFNFCSNTSVYVEIKNSKLTGWASLNIWSNGVSIYAENSTFVGINNKTQGVSNTFCTICFEGDTTAASTTGASNVQVLLKNCKIEAQTTGNTQALFGYNQNQTAGAKSNSLMLDSCELTVGDGCLFAYDNGTDNTLNWKNTKVNNVCVADFITGTGGSAGTSEIAVAIGNAVEFKDGIDSIIGYYNANQLIGRNHLTYLYYHSKNIELCNFQTGTWIELLTDVVVSKTVNLDVVTISLVDNSKIYSYGGTFGIILNGHSLTAKDNETIRIPYGVIIAINDSNSPSVNASIFSAPTGYEVVELAVVPEGYTKAFSVIEQSSIQ